MKKLNLLGQPLISSLSTHRLEFSITKPKHRMHFLRYRSCKKSDIGYAYCCASNRILEAPCDCSVVFINTGDGWRCYRCHKKRYFQ